MYFCENEKDPLYIYETRMDVRDYESDIEGIVNNANYLH
jgi:acyl-CoA thioester hydrolase